MKNNNERPTRDYVIEQLNQRFSRNIMSNDIQFIKSESSYGICIYVKGNALRGDITSGLNLNESFFALLSEQLKRIGINEIPQWNNGRNTFACWINNNTCSWNK